MAEPTAQRPLFRWGVWGLVAAVVVMGFVFRDRWWPESEGFLRALTKSSHADEPDHHEEDGESQDDNVLKVSKQALATLDIKVAPLKRVDYARMIRVPGQVVDIRGVSNQDVTCGLSGVVSRVYIRPGQSVKPGEPLFDVKLIHETAVQIQLDLIDALAEQEVVDAIVTRLQSMNQRGGSDLVPGVRIFEQQYKRRQLEHTIATRKQALLLLGFSEEQVSHIVEEHSAEKFEVAGDAAKDSHLHEKPLVDQITIHAPSIQADSTGLPPQFLVAKLLVRQGEHVELGQLLCRLADYRRLQIEGQAYERDLSIVRRAMDEGWPVSARVKLASGSTQHLRALRILYLNPRVDSETRSAHFYVDLENSLRKMAVVAGRDYPDWEFRPGQRIEIRVPMKQFEKSFVVPVTAVVQDGVENYVFQSGGTTFVRRSVTVLFRDQDNVVLGDSERVFEGTPLAMTGAYQLQLALRNRSSGPAAGHGHSHAGHAH